METELKTDILIVGGGIVGAGIFRDLALHGINTLLIEKGDISSQTSERSSKMLHGGIRYLENFDFDLVKEALSEKNLWLKLAPHLCYESKFFLPVYTSSKRPLWMIKVGLFLYDLLSKFQNSPHQIANKDEIISNFPEISKKGLKGAGVYYDAIVDDSKLNLEVIYDSILEPNASVMTHTEFKNITNIINGHIVTVFDHKNECEKKIFCKKIVFALGPFTDLILKKIKIFNWGPVLLPSRGAHLWLKKESLKIKTPMLLQTKDDRVLFVIPQKNQILAGTTESPVIGDPFDVKANDDEINYILNNIKNYFPKSSLSHSDIISSFCGIRPLVKEGNSTSRGKTARVHKVFRPHKNCYVIVGGKYTTFRAMAQDITREVVQSFNKVYNPDKTKSPLRKKSIVPPFDKIKLENINLKKILNDEFPKNTEDLLKRRIGLTSLKESSVISFIEKNKDLLDNYFSTKDNLDR